MPSKNEVDIWMPLFIEKYLGDTSSFETVEHGAYLLILMEMWKRNGFLDNDLKSLKNVTKMTPKRFTKAWTKIKSFLRQNDKGQWYSPKLIKELIKAKNYKKTQSLKGAKGAEARWGKDGTGNATANGTGNGRKHAQAMPRAGEGTGIEGEATQAVKDLIELNCESDE